MDKRLKTLLMQTIIDLFRPYESSKNTQLSHMKEILFIMTTLEKQKIDNLNKSSIVKIKQILEPLFTGSVALDL